MFETVLEVAESPAELILKKEDVDTDGMNYLAGKSVDFVNKSAMNGTILAHTDGSVPNLKVTIPAMDAYSLGSSSISSNLPAASVDTFWASIRSTSRA